MTEEETDDGSIDYPKQYQDAMNERKEIVATLRNHLHVLMTNALSAASDTHTAMCKFSEEHAAQEQLSDAMHSNLIAAEQARQALKYLDAAR